MKTAIVGSTSFKDYIMMQNALSTYTITSVVSGGAPGADSLAERYAKENNIPLLVLHADWNNLKAEPCFVKNNRWGRPYNALAGFNRNKKIVENSDVIVAFWNGKSPGTRDTIEYARNVGKPVFIHKFEGDKIVTNTGK